jgi:hypothetical protein
MQDIVERIFGRIGRGEFGEKARNIIWSLNNQSREKVINLMEAFSKALSSEFPEYFIEEEKIIHLGNQDFKDKCKVISIYKLVLSDRNYWQVKLKIRKRNLEEIFKQIPVEEKPIRTFVGRGSFWTEVLDGPFYKVTKNNSEISLLNAIISEYSVDN